MAGGRRGKRDIVGIIPALVTPFSDDGTRVREDVLIALAQDLAAGGASALMSCGGTAEFEYLSHDERRRLTEVVVGAVDGSVPVVVQTGAMTTRETIELSRHAEQAGAAGVMVFTPYVRAPTWGEVRRHYEAVAEAISLPIMAYHRTNARLTCDQLQELAQIEGVEFLKESSADAVLLTELIQRGLPGCEILVGWESLTFYGFAAGLRGTVSAAANFMLPLMVELLDALAVKADLDLGRQVWARIWPLFNFLETHSFMPAVKAACEMLGYSVGPARAPALALGRKDRDELQTLISNAALTLRNG